MFLYTEEQLKALYKIYTKHQNKNNLTLNPLPCNFCRTVMKLEDFRNLFEDLLGEIENAF